MFEMFKKKFDIISIGDAAIDSFLFLGDEDIKISNGPKGKLATISWGDKLPVKQFYKSVAGNASNNAVASSRLGLHAAFYTVIGDDSGGREIKHRMAKEGVATDYIELHKNYGTNYHTVLSNHGERTIFVYHGKRAYKLPDFAQSKWVYLTSIGAGFASIYPALKRYLQENDVRLGFNPGTYQLRAGPKQNASMLKLTDFLCVNKEEAISWVGKGSFDVLAKKLCAMGPKAVAITDGRKGAFSYSAEGLFYLYEFPGFTRIEATGAGDSFTSAYLAALAYGKSHFEALRWGPVNAGSVVNTIGPIDGLLTRKEIERYLKSKPSYQPIQIKNQKDMDKVLKIMNKKMYQ